MTKLARDSLLRAAQHLNIAIKELMAMADKCIDEAETMEAPPEPSASKEMIAEFTEVSP